MFPFLCGYVYNKKFYAPSKLLNSHSELSSGAKGVFAMLLPPSAGAAYSGTAGGFPEPPGRTRLEPARGPAPNVSSCS